MKIISVDPLKKVEESTMVQLYKLLIRSVYEYSSFLIDRFLIYTKTLKAIKNKIKQITLQHFSKKWNEIATDDLRDRARISTIESLENP